jgi:hypothetical protein
MLKSLIPYHENFPPNFNYPLIEDFASRTLGELSVIAKHATKDYFSVGPAYSYFTGCSNGGRQGLELAQSFPDAFDGILAGAPAVYWPTLLMNQLGVFPPSCEIKAFTAAAVERCDGSDGLEDGIISQPADCDFDVQHVIGRNFTCCDDDDDDDDDGEQRPFTQAGACQHRRGGVARLQRVWCLLAGRRDGSRSHRAPRRHSLRRQPAPGARPGSSA